MSYIYIAHISNSATASKKYVFGNFIKKEKNYKLFNFN